MSDKKQVVSLQVLATKTIAQLYFDKLSGKYLLERTYSLPKSIFLNILDEVTDDFEDVLSVRGGNSLYFVLSPEESDFGVKPYDYQSLVLENKLDQKLWFQIRPLFILDSSFDCLTHYFPPSSIEPNECLSIDICLDLSTPLTLRRRTIRQEIDTKAELYIYVWDRNPIENTVATRRGIIGITCGLFLGKNLPLNFELVMTADNKNSVKKTNEVGKFFEQKDHVKRYLFS